MTLLRIAGLLQRCSARAMGDVLVYGSLDQLGLCRPAMVRPRPRHSTMEAVVPT